MKKLLIPLSILIPLLLGYSAQFLMTYIPEYIFTPILRFVFPLITLTLWYFVGKGFGSRYYSPTKAALIAHCLGLYSVIVLTAAQLGAPLPIRSHLLNIGPQMYFLPLLSLAAAIINVFTSPLSRVFGAITLYPIYHYILILLMMQGVFRLGFKKQAKKYTIFI